METVANKAKIIAISLPDSPFTVGWGHLHGARKSFHGLNVTAHQNKDLAENEDVALIFYLFLNEMNCH